MPDTTGKALAAALDLLREERASWIECGSLLRTEIDGTVTPVPGTLDESTVEIVARYDEVIAMCAEALKDREDLIAALNDMEVR